jgi:hypothetical protein
MTETATEPASEATLATGTRAMRIAHNLGWTLIYLGVLTLGFVVHQLYVTTWFAQQNQPELAAHRAVGEDRDLRGSRGGDDGA